ncbi:MAG: hypothetical protein HYY24_03660 [Verrucomicrobia bacterium]|nr:hypothetical protein [Verrucomicrobiota bacterium]
MQKQPYSSLPAKVGWFVDRFGLAEVFWKPVRVVCAPLVIPCLARRSFAWQGAELEYFYHRYNMTWASERCIEIPIAKSYLNQYRERRVLEVGNVLSHYFPAAHDVLDKFERGPNVINQDIVGFAPGRRYDLILSISTFEHIGFDDDATEPSGKKIQAAIATCRALLEPAGKLVLTVPLGYNPDLDMMIRNGELGTTREFYFHRPQRRHWEPCGKEQALTCRFKTPFPYANALLVAEFSSTSGG